MRRKSALFYPILSSLLFICLYYNVQSTIRGHHETRGVKDNSLLKSRPAVQRQALPHQKYHTAVKQCPSYMEYASIPHFRDVDEATPLSLPFQRPPENCRTFKSPMIESFVVEFIKKLKDRDLAKLFENTFPNTLDTTILWHVSASENQKLEYHKQKSLSYRNEFPETFIVTGDIHAEWLRDSAWQVSVYQPFIKHDSRLKELLHGAINTQAQLLIENPFCNAFNPPPYCDVQRAESTVDKVRPYPDWRRVFECKYEIDSLASFLTLSRQFYENADWDDRLSFINIDWLLAVKRVIEVVELESSSTFAEEGAPNGFPYTFQRDTNVASETLPLAGTGNPVNSGTGLVRSAFRPSDDSTIFQFFIPGNAYIAVELKAVFKIMQDYVKSGKAQDPYIPEIEALMESAADLSERIRQGIMEHGIVNHPNFGEVFAYEVDGYGSSLLMDDANIPSLLSLPELGFVSINDPIYQNTRRMITSKEGNPYYIRGEYLQGIGGPHIGIHNVWPLGLIVAIRTSDNDQEILDNLSAILHSTGGLGLIHESIQAFRPGGKLFTRPWFAWANSEFAKTILYLAETRPHLIFQEQYLGEKFELQSFLSALEPSQHL
ncbi:LAME_0D04082g1_1 [Lachancea meyersii CBS 8951]|uniref:LAME_0D04082g1_1 n=1 Tax=Lachancea meyersii CBS 8951 TaxID=1266667 RepID=A0A1G4J7X8_9SACH|nr:LAME_0D04082g1_1 [Lachancea meyersii CBS 8951]